jgi:DNA polymerase III gamma/tau subunit
MKGILDKHTIPHDDDAVLTVIDYSGGHVRDILNRLEMVAQTGEVSLSAVREYLNLSVVSTYYEILLALREPKQAIALAEQLCERLGADEVAAGLAEAAMNAFRLHHGMFADFVYVDKSLGQRLYAAYGNDVVRLAEHFLRQRYTSKISLLCDILNLSAGVPTTVAVQAPAPILVVAGPPQETSVSPQSLPKDISPPAQTNSSANNKTAPVFTNGKGMLRPDGVGNLGSGDVGALTSVDQYGVARQMPRGRAHVETPIQFSRTAESDDNKVLSPEEWKREFELTWPGRA